MIFFRCNDFTTNSTYLCGSTSSFCTGSVVFSSDCFNITNRLTAIGTLYCYRTGSSTSCTNGCCSGICMIAELCSTRTSAIYIVVSCCIDNLCVRITTRTGKCSYTVFGTGCCLSHNTAVIAMCMSTGAGRSINHVEQVHCISLSDSMASCCNINGDNVASACYLCAVYLDVGCCLNKYESKRTVRWSGKADVGRGFNL